MHPANTIRSSRRRRMDPGITAASGDPQQRTATSPTYKKAPPTGLAGRHQRWRWMSGRPLHRRREHDRDARSEEQVVEEAVVVLAGLGVLADEQVRVVVRARRIVGER